MRKLQTPVAASPEKAAAGRYDSLNKLFAHGAKMRHRCTPSQKRIYDELVKQNDVIQEAAKNAGDALVEKRELHNNATELMKLLGRWITALPV